jgi:flagellar biosynthesis/type III secretory pathway protein FliH
MKTIAIAPRGWTLAWFVALSAGLCLCLPAQAQWKWRDKSGQITVSDLPPPRDVAEADILQRPDPAALARPAPVPASGAASAVPVVQAPVDRELQARKQAAEQELAAKARADEERIAEQRRHNCRNARNTLAGLDSGQRMARINDKGEREIMDDKMRADAARQAREVIASDCR